MEIATHLSETVLTSYGKSSSLQYYFFTQLWRINHVSHKEMFSLDLVAMSLLGSRGNVLLYCQIFSGDLPAFSFVQEERCSVTIVLEIMFVGEF